MKHNHNPSSFLTEPKVRQWMHTLESNGCAIRCVEPLSLLHKSNGELLFGLVSVDADTPGHGKLPRYAMIRGHACVIVVEVHNRETREKRFVMIRQWRTGSGTYSLEFPAGMLDRNIDEPEETAVNEVREETGLVITRTDLFPLADRVLYSSPGLQDEGIYFFGCCRAITTEEANHLEGLTAGAASENERITVTLKTRDDIERETDSLQVRLGLFLFEQAMRYR